MMLSTSPTAAMAGLLLALGYITPAVAQTFQRLGTCPSLGCIFPPTQAEFIAGGHFDIRLEVSPRLWDLEAFLIGAHPRSTLLSMDPRHSTTVFPMKTSNLP